MMMMMVVVMMMMMAAAKMAASVYSEVLVIARLYTPDDSVFKYKRT
jgi:hypothetical protein